MATVLTQEQRAEIERVVRTISTADIEVRGVDIDVRDEPSEPYVLVAVKLSKPSGETWPLKDFYDLRRRAHEAVAGRQMSIFG